MDIPAIAVQACELLFCVGAAYLFIIGGLCILHDFASFMDRRFRAESKEVDLLWGKLLWAMTTVVVSLFVYFTLHDLWMVLKAAALAAFLYCCGLGTLSCYLDLQRSDAS